MKSPVKLIVFGAILAIYVDWVRLAGDVKNLISVVVEEVSEQRDNNDEE